MSQARNMVRVMRRQLEKDNFSQPIELTQIPREQWDRLDHSDHTRLSRIEVWRNRKYLVQVFKEPSGIIRISVNASRITNTGAWGDGLSWEELQQIKREIGRGDLQAIEIYPPDADVVNVANMRHLWILPVAVNAGWKRP